MALTNIFREPRREIVETLVGIVVITVPIWLDYRFGQWVEAASTPADPIPWQVGMLFGVLISFVVVFVAIAVHEIGDAACNALQRRGVHLRPRNRVL